MNEPIGPDLKRYIQKLMREMIGEPHILNPFNTCHDGKDLRQPAPPEDKAHP